jgi:hypothetical protein
MPLITQNQARSSGIPRKTLQTILISKAFSIPESKAWLKKHGYANSYWRNGGKHGEFRRWMQTPPIKDAKYHTITLANGVELVFQEY